jgi:acetolactate synthase-1/2/3 large subunit
VDRIFGVPGEENLDTVESLRASSIELVLTRHEQAAAFMAATHGRLTGRPGVCLGPGALNFSTGAAYAHLGAMPMILITGQKAIMTARQARFQIVDVIASMGPLTKMTRQIVSAASIPAIVREAFRVAMEERPGPVHLELPEDVAGEEIEPVPLVPPHPVALVGRGANQLFAPACDFAIPRKALLVQYWRLSGEFAHAENLEGRAAHTCAR